jgi:chromosome partitioning protein
VTIQATGWDWVFIDCPPAFIPTIEDAIEHADLALIPLRPGALDLLGSEEAVAAAQEAGTPFLCVLNDVDPRWIGAKGAREYLETAGVPVAKTIVAHRAAFFTAMGSGKTGPEIEKNGKAAEEIDNLFSEIKAALKRGHR